VHQAKQLIQSVKKMPQAVLVDKVEQNPVQIGRLWYHAEIDILAMIHCIRSTEQSVDQTEAVALLNQQLQELYVKAANREAELLAENAERARQVEELRARDEAMQAHIIAESVRSDEGRARKLPRHAV